MMAFDSVPVTDGELAGSYGKFIAPSGIDLAMSVQSDTAVNGQLVLRSIFTVDQGPATIKVFAPAPGTVGPVMAVGAGTGQAQSAPQNTGLSVTIDRTGANMAVSPTYGAQNWTPNIVVGSAAQSAARADHDGLVPVDVAIGGGAVDTGAGAVSAAATANGSRIILDGAGLSISHLVGGAVGSVVANTANDRTIDTVTSVSIDIRNAETLSIASAQLRVDAIATAATGAMVR